MASSASMEQCSLTGGRQSSFAISVFLIDDASFKDFPEKKSERLRFKNFQVPLIFHSKTKREPDRR